jgi:glycerol kinase
MADDVGEDIEMLRIDGGMANNDWLAQYLADITRTPVARPAFLETTALGAARLAGLQAGVFDDLNALQEAWIADQTFDPSMSDSRRRTLLSTWRRAVRAAIAFSEKTGD